MGAEERGWDSSVNIMKGECAWSSKDEAAASGRNSAQGGPADGARHFSAPRSARGEKSDREAMPPPPAPPREPRPVGGRSARNRFAVDTTTESEGSGGESTRSMRSSASLPRMATRGGGEVLKVSVSLDPNAPAPPTKSVSLRSARGDAGGATAPADGGDGTGDVFQRLASSSSFTALHAQRHAAATPRGTTPPAESTADPARSSPPPETCGYACAHTLRGHAGAVFSLTSAKGQLFSAAQDAAVRVWPLGKGAAAAAAAEPPASVELVGHAGFVRALAVSGGGALLFSGSADKSVRVWDTNTHVQLCALSGHKHEVHALAVHNDLLFSGAEDATIKVWNIASLKCIRTLAGANGHTGAVFALAVCGDPPVLASGSRDHTIRLWELSTLEWRQTCGTSHFDSVVAFAAVGNTLYSGSRDRHIKRWSLRDGACLHSAVNAHDDWVCALAASEADGLLVSGGRDGRIKLWGLASFEDGAVGTLDGHSASVNRILFQDGAIVSASSDRTVRLWTKG